jgi:hypothetical protein
MPSFKILLYSSGIVKIKKPEIHKRIPAACGGGKGIRTLDPSVANAVLSQLSYAPTDYRRRKIILMFRIFEEKKFVK